ncbi:MAG: DUF5009 domain-containing protein [Bacteroidota bacterium]
MIFPFFLFIVGVAIPLAISRQFGHNNSESILLLRVLRRSIILFALGLVLRGFPNYDFSTICI